MADGFLTSRMTDSTFLKDVDDGYQALEDAIVYFFGLPVDNALSGKVFPYTDIDGNITSIFRSAGQSAVPTMAGAPGWRSRDTTTGDEFILVCNGDYLRVYENTGSQASPTWTERNKMSLTTGLWDVGSVIDVGSGCRVEDIYGIPDFGSGAMVPFEWEIFDDASYWSTADRTRFTITEAGRYRVHWNIDCFYPYDPYESDQSIYASLYLGGVEIVSSRVGTATSERTGGDPMWPLFANTGFFHFDALVVDDYIQLGAVVDGGTLGSDILLNGAMEIERLV